MRKVALITGITGQDGSYLAEFLIEKGYEVHGILRRSSSFNTGRIEHLYLDEWVRDMKKSRLVNLHWGDMTDSSSLIRIISDIHPTEIYNLAAQSHVKVSFDVPEYTAEADAIGTLRLLEAVRICGLDKTCRIYQASTSELFGKVQEIPQKETTPFYPRSPYGVAKQYGFWITKNYRESYGMFAVNGILFNHESERRGETFVTRKITLAAARIKQGFQDKLYLGNLDAKRDWGYAKDYVECMWLILQNETPEDFVIATGEMHTVREFCTLTFKYLDIELTRPVDSVDAVRRMNEESVEGLEILSLRQISDEKKMTGMTILSAADYLVSLKSGKLPDHWQELFADFMSQKEIRVVKQTKRSEKEVDIRPLIHQWEIKDQGIFLKLAAGSRENLKPDLVMDAFLSGQGIPDDTVSFFYHRLEMYADSEENTGAFVSLEAMGHDMTV